MKRKKTEKTRLLLEEVCGSGFNETQQSVIAVILNSIHCGVRQEMASTLETISNYHYELNDCHSEFEVKPSDSTAVHRICGWALKSTSDRFEDITKRGRRKGEKRRSAFHP